MAAPRGRRACAVRGGLIIELSLVGLATAFAGGLISFLWPCVLPIVPAYVSLCGRRVVTARATGRNAAPRFRFRCERVLRIRVSTVFVVLGASASALGQLILQFRHVPTIGRQRRAHR